MSLARIIGIGMATEFSDIRDAIGIECAWKCESFVHPRYLIVARDEETPLLELKKRWLWANGEVQFAWRGFRGTYTIESPQLNVLQPSTIPGWLFGLSLYRGVTRSASGVILAIEIAGHSYSERGQLGRITTASAQYDMFLWNARLTICDDAGELVTCNWLDTGVIPVRWVCDTPLLVAHALWMRIRS